MEVKYVYNNFMCFPHVNPRLEHKKDPGIPNDFPYKDQILAEVQEERRLVRMVDPSTSFLLIIM